MIASPLLLFTICRRRVSWFEFGCVTFVCGVVVPFCFFAARIGNCSVEQYSVVLQSINCRKRYTKKKLLKKLQKLTYIKSVKEKTAVKTTSFENYDRRTVFTLQSCVIASPMEQQSNFKKHMITLPVSDIFGIDMLSTCIFFPEMTFTDLMLLCLCHDLIPKNLIVARKYSFGQPMNAMHGRLDNWVTRLLRGSTE